MTNSVPTINDIAHLKAAYTVFMKAGHKLARQRDRWIDACFALGDALLAAREKHTSNQAFSGWLAAQKIDLSDDNRAALLNLARHKAIAIDIARESKSLSVDTM